MPKASNRRCFFFDRDGNPIDDGCPRPTSACGFYHPDEEGWHTARTTTKTFSRGPKKQHSNKRPSYEFKRDSGYPRHRQGLSRSRSISPPLRTRHDSIASTVPDQVESPRNFRTSVDLRTTSLNNVSSNKTLQQLPSLTLSANIPRLSSPTTQSQPQVSSSSSMMNSTSSLPTPAPLRPGLPVTAFGMPRAIRSPPRWPPAHRTGQPAPPKDPSPMPPPQPLPAVLPVLSAGVAISKTVEPTPEEKRVMWEERTRILSESGLAREHLATIEEQHVYALKVVESRYFANLPEEEKTPLKSQLAEIEKEREEAKRLYEESVDKLLKTGSWPVAPPSAVEDGVEEKHKEVVKYIQELQDTALQISKILGDISMFKSPPLLFLSADSDDVDGTAMDLDQPGSDNAHRKRRRISNNLDERSDSASSMPTQAELDEFLERLVHMEGLISTLENDINQHAREAREEFEQLVDTKLDDFQVAREEAEKQRLEEEQQQMQNLEQDITLTGEQVGELASEIGDLIMRVGKLEVDVGASRKGRQESFEKVLEVERRLQEYISTRDVNAHVIQTFEKALNAYTSQPPSPPASPLNTLPPFDYIFQSLEEPMIQSLRSYLVPAIEDLRKDVEKMVHTQNAELYSTLWNKMTVTLKVLEMIQSKINNGDIEPGQSLSENVLKR